MQKMKVMVYSYREDEAPYFEQLSKQYHLELIYTEEELTLETAELAKGISTISIVTNLVNQPILEKLKAAGVQFISTRTIGYDHIDIESAKALGIRTAHISYSPDSVANYTLMLMLMCIRQMKVILDRFAGQDYSLAAVRGREMHNLTIGIIGTGRIGQTVIRMLSGFGCRIIAYDLYQNEDVKQYAKYVDLGTLYKEADLISLHIPATKEMEHMINKEAFAQMKEGVILINTARGTLIDTMALVEALENKKVSAAGLDVIEEETDIYYKDYKAEPIKHRSMALLKSFPNVIMTPHTAFYTDQAVYDMVNYSLLGCIAFQKGEKVDWEV